jgi:hypothetical protein
VFLKVVHGHPRARSQLVINQASLPRSQPRCSRGGNHE